MPEAEGIVNSSPYVIHDDLPYERPIQEYFPTTAPLHVEIGTGKGGFIVELAKRHPEINYIGVERYESVLFRACEKMDEMPDDERPSNLLFISRDAGDLTQILAENDVDRIYLNFSDPWPKKRHAKRRLTSHVYLDLYEKFLKPDGELVFKTDNVGLFDFSLEEIGEAPHWELTAMTRDLHHDETLGKDNIMTEYEKKFSALGNKINKLVAIRRV